MVGKNISRSSKASQEENARNLFLSKDTTASTWHCTMCTLGSMFTSQPKKLRPILTFVFCIIRIGSQTIELLGSTSNAHPLQFQQKQEGM